MENPLLVIQTISNDLIDVKNLLSDLCRQKIVPEPSPEEDLTNIKGASKILQKTTGTIYNLCGKNKIPYFKKDGKLYFSKKSLLNYIREGKISTLKELEDNVNDTLGQQKKHKAYTQSEMVKRFTSSIDIDNSTTEGAVKLATDTFFDAHQDTLKNNK